MSVTWAWSRILVGCASSAPLAEFPSGSLIGGDHDAHHCIAPASYRWCAHENACVRPLELAARAGILSDGASFRQYCDDSAN
jgi:hypothetical protein